MARLSYEQRIVAGLERSFRRAGRDELRADLGGVRWAIFSDHHRGERGADDPFVSAERAYNAALGWYLEAGYTLLLLGDVEELWGFTPHAVARAYPRSLGLEAEFHARNRLIKFAGNHDAAWASPATVREQLWPRFPGLEVREGLRLRVLERGRTLGTLFLAHGHQGATFSDRHQWIARLAVRNVWHPVQRVVGRPATTPAADFALRERHDRALYGWARGRAGVVLIAGHTHRPVFMSESRIRKVGRELRDARLALALHPHSRGARREVARLRAELEWLRAEEDEAPGSGAGPGNGLTPCYFNAGCCSFEDGDITGLEIADGQIRLVRWPDRDGRPGAEVLAAADLAEDVFAFVRSSDRPPGGPAACKVPAAGGI